MTRLLISFCNASPPGLSLGLYDFGLDRFQWLDLSELGDHIASTTGICLSHGACWCIVTGPEDHSRLVMLDHQLRTRRVFDLREARDAHSLISFEVGFLVNDTRRNSVTRLVVDGARLHESPFWSYCGQTTDVVHVNSVANLEGQVFVSMFGEKPPTGWSAANHGQIVNVSTGEIITRDLIHPHSLITLDGGLYWLESGTGRLHRYSKRDGHEILATIDGYVRGFVTDERYYYVAVSARRRRSRSTGTPNAPVALTSSDANSWIYRIDRMDGSRERRRLTAFGAEIFDLAVVPEDFHSPATPGIDPVVQRIWQFEDDLLQAQAHFAAAIQERDNRILALTREQEEGPSHRVRP